MPPEPRLATIATIQQAITSLLTTYEPTFLTFGLTFFRSIAVILIVWHGIKMMFTQQTVNTGLQKSLADQQKLNAELQAQLNPVPPPAPEEPPQQPLVQ